MKLFKKGKNDVVNKTKLNTNPSTINNLDVEAEGGELILHSNSGDIAIIPKKHADKVQLMLNSKKDYSEAIEELVLDLPSEVSTAAEGLFKENETKSRLETASENIRNYYNQESTLYNNKEELIKNYNTVGSYGVKAINSVLHLGITDSKETTSKRHPSYDNFNAANLPYKKYQSPTDSTAYVLHAKVDSYGLADDSHRNPVYVKNWSITDAEGAHFSDNITLEEFNKEKEEMKLMQELDKPYYSPITENSSLYNYKKVTY